MSNPSGQPKYKVCDNCSAKVGTALHCPATRKETQWVYDRNGKARTVTGGVCGRTIENYGRPVAEDAA